MGANLCLKNINDKHSPTKGINVNPLAELK